jgi:hypothetical protein
MAMTMNWFLTSQCILTTLDTLNTSRQLDLLIPNTKINGESFPLIDTDKLTSLWIIPIRFIGPTAFDSKSNPIGATRCEIFEKLTLPSLLQALEYPPSPHVKISIVIINASVILEPTCHEVIIKTKSLLKEKLSFANDVFSYINQFELTQDIIFFSRLDTDDAIGKYTFRDIYNTFMQSQLPFAVLSPFWGNLWYPTATTAAAAAAEHNNMNHSDKQNKTPNNKNNIKFQSQEKIQSNNRDSTSSIVSSSSGSSNSNRYTCGKMIYKAMIRKFPILQTYAYNKVELMKLFGIIMPTPPYTYMPHTSNSTTTSITTISSTTTSSSSRRDAPPDTVNNDKNIANHPQNLQKLKRLFTKDSKYLLPYKVDHKDPDQIFRRIRSQVQVIMFIIIIIIIIINII